MVVAFHGFPTIVRGGYVGVDVFFVISGYLITGIILEPLRTGTFSVADFYRRRIRRLFPALFLVLVTSYVAGWFLLSPPDFATLGAHIASSAAFIPNLVFWHESGYFDQAAPFSPLRHLWSLGVEEQFYLVWPLTLYLLIRTRRSASLGLLVLTLGSFIACVAIVGSNPTEAFYAPFTRAWELGLGALLMTCRIEGRAAFATRIVANYASIASWAGVALICGSALLLTGTSTFPGASALLPTGGAVLIIAAGRGAAANRILSTPAIVFIGLISYPLYLWHWPLISFSYIYAKGTPPVLVRVAVIVLAVCLATVTYLFVERPIRRRKPSAAPVYVLVVLVAGIGALGLTTNATTARFRGPIPESVQAVFRYGSSYNPGSGARANRCWLPATTAFSHFAEACYLQPSTAHTSGLIIWGDSHAGRLYPGLRNALEPRANIGQFDRDSCPPFLDASSECGRSNRDVLAMIREVKPNLVILFAVWSSYSSDWSSRSGAASELAQTSKSLQDAGVKHVLVLGPDPKWLPDLPTAIYDNWKQHHSSVVPQRLSIDIDRSIFPTDSAIAKIARANGAEFFSILGSLCNQEGCLTYVPRSPGNLFTWDYGHLTTPGATFVVDRLIERGLLP